MRGVATLYAQARAAWPNISLAGGEPAFAQHLQRHTAPGAVASSLCIEDLYLAFACAQGNEAALLAFETRHLSQVDHFLSPGDRQPAFLDELRQSLRDKFFVGRNGEAPKIADYSGRGSLHSWVRTAAVHTARNMHRSRKSDLLRDSNDLALQSLRSDQDPELSFLKSAYQKEFQEACQAALAALPEEQREVLRLHYVEGLNIDRIGVQLGVNRATVARWRTAAQQAVLEETRKELRKRLRISDSDFASLVRLVRSQLYVSLPRLFGSARKSGAGP